MTHGIIVFCDLFSGIFSAFQQRIRNFKCRHLHVWAPMSAFRPVTQMLASSGVEATKSKDSKSSPYIIENAQSSACPEDKSRFRRISVLFPTRISFMLSIGTVKIEYRI
jgi:hypothetical protein